MNGNQVINVEKALDEKRQLQKIFIREKGYPSSVLELIISHFEAMKTQGGGVKA